MEMHQVRYFLALCDHKGFTRAAKSCNVSQPALTNAIKKLEEELSSQLFIRGNKSVELTAFGRIVQPKFQALMSQSDCIFEIAKNVEELRTVPVRVGILNTIGPGRIATTLRHFWDKAPEAEVELISEKHADLLTMLEDGKIDFLMSHFQEPAPDWCVLRKIYSEAYRLLLPPSHHLTLKEDIKLADLNGEAYIDRVQCEMRHIVEKACKRKEIQLYPAYRAFHENWIESLVAEGIGSALMPEFSIQSHTTIVRQVSDLKLKRDISIARNTEHQAPPVAQKLWQTLRETSSHLR